MFQVSFYSPDATMKQTVHTSSNQTESSGCNGARVCAIYVRYNKLKLSDLFYISMWAIYQLQQERYQTNSIQQQKYSILAKSNTLFWTHLVFVLCNLYGLKQTEVYRSLLYIYWDNISTPTSVMSFVVRISQRYVVSNKSRLPHLCKFEACDCVIYMWYEKLQCTDLFYISTWMIYKL